MNLSDLQKLIKKGENDQLEFKENFQNSVIESIVAFANQKGGKIIIGISDSKQIKGVITGEETVQNWLNEIKNKTEPNIMPMADIIEVNTKKVIVFSIIDYPIKPVSFKGKYYIRKGNSNHKMGISEVVDLHFQSIHISWDFYRDPETTLGAIDIEKVKDFIKMIEKRKLVKISEDPITVLKKYELVKENNDVTFACSLLFKKIISASNKITLAKFQGIDKMITKDSLVVEDSLIYEVDQVMNFIKKNIHMGLVLDYGETRNREVWDYPLDAIREIVINAIVHKDYRANSDIQVYMYDDRIEIANPGKFPEGMSLDGIKKGLYKSLPRNKLVAKIFKELGIIEEFGSGIRKIMNLFQKSKMKQPIINMTDGFITYICYKNDDNNQKIIQKSTPKKTSKKADNDTNKGGGNKKKVHQKSTPKSTQKIINLIKQNSKISIKEISEYLSITQRAIKKHIKNLKDAGYLERKGSNRGGYREIM